MNGENADESFFKRWYNYSCSMSKLVGIVPSMPRLASRQMHRQNAEADTPEDCYRRNVCLPFLDHLIQGIDSRFDKYGKTILLMMGLVPAVVADKEDVTIDDAVKMYADYLPSPINVEEEFMAWKRRWKATEKRLKPSSIAQALKECDSDMYPNVSVLLKIAGTVPVTSCECERSGGVLKRLNTCLRASMGQERLSGLALMHINYDIDIDIERVIKIIVSKKQRAL